jgi:hypothetical protein
LRDGKESDFGLKGEEHSAGGRLQVERWRKLWCGLPACWYHAPVFPFLVEDFSMAKRKILSVQHFGPIESVEVGFGDISVLVGPQATGKSLVLQWLKLAVDDSRILGTLNRHGFEAFGKGDVLIGHFFGEDYAKSYIQGRTEVRFDGRAIVPDDIAQGRRSPAEIKALYVPAHRALVMGTGWPRFFREQPDGTPFVVREFSARVLDVLAARESETAFPAPRRFRDEMRKKIDEALFHGGRVVVKTRGIGRKELRLLHDNADLAIMEWTTGQREALPMLLGLYWALTAGGVGRRRNLEWVIVEEPELGLHPDGVLAMTLLLLEVANRGYRLVVSTHSPLILDVLWAIRLMKDGPREKRVQKFLDIFGLRKNAYTAGLAESILGKQVSVTYLDFEGFEGRRVRSIDISKLDPSSSDDAIAGWGGLLRHSSRIAEVISDAE